MPLSPLSFPILLVRGVPRFLTRSSSSSRIVRCIFPFFYFLLLLDREKERDQIIFECLNEDDEAKAVRGEEYKFANEREI